MNVVNKLIIQSSCTILFLAINFFALLHLENVYATSTVNYLIVFMFLQLEFIKYIICKSEFCFKHLIIILSTTVFYYFAAVLFGATLTSKTLSLSIILTGLTILPACTNLTPQHTLNLLLGDNLKTPLSLYVQRNIIFTLFGTWLGAFVIPLDWDRSWQEWPIPCVIGAMTGSLFYHTYTLISNI